MSLLFAAFTLVSCAFITCHAAPTEDVVSYAGYQVWALTPRSNEENELLLKVIQDNGIQIQFTIEA